MGRKEECVPGQGSVLREGTKVDYSKQQAEEGEEEDGLPRAKGLIDTKVKIFFTERLREPIIIFTYIF